MSGSVYGEQILAFPELQRSFPAFDMAALHGAGYGPRTGEHTVRGVFQCTLGRMVKDSNGNLVRSRDTRFWTRETIVVGTFMECEGDVYRVGMPDNEWKREGGFTVYNLKKLVGNDGREVVEPAFDTGAREMG